MLTSFKKANPPEAVRRTRHHMSYACSSQTGEAKRSIRQPLSFATLATVITCPRAHDLTWGFLAFGWLPCVSKQNDPGTLRCKSRTTRPLSSPLCICSNTSLRFSSRSVRKCVLMMPLAAKSSVSIASGRFPTATPTIFCALTIRFCGKAVAMGLSSPSGIPTQTRVPPKSMPMTRSPIPRAAICVAK